jgi:hypothetical protein
MAALLTRRELYELVWAHPMSKIAVDLGVSDVALHKICAKNGIPKPERGYWAKVAAGKPVEKKPFKDDGHSGATEISIHGSLLRDLAPAVLEVKKKAEAAAKAMAKDGMWTKPPIQPHPLIERLKTSLEKSKPEKTGFVHTTSGADFSVRIMPSSAPRTLALLTSLVSQAEALGFAFVRGEMALELAINTERVSMSITEQTSPIAHIPTAAELARKEKWEKARDRAVRRGEYFSTWGQPEIPEFDFVPNGDLLLQLDPGPHRDGIRRKFSDGKRQRLENMVPAILASAAACAAAESARKEEHARWEREWKERERQRQELERRQRLIRKRFEFIDSVREAHEQAERLDRFLTYYVSRSTTEPLPPNLERLVAWAGAQAAQLRRRISAPALEAALATYRLMDDTTDLSEGVKVDRHSWRRNEQSLVSFPLAGADENSDIS